MTDFKVGDTLYQHFTTLQFSDGVPTTLIGTPVAEAYEDASDTGITAGVSLTIDHAETGHHLLTVVATGGNGFEAGKMYGVSLTAGTVGGVSVVGEVIFNFSLGKSAVIVNDALVALGLDHLISTSVSDVDVADNSIIAQMVDAGSTSDYTNYSPTEDSLRAISEKVSSIGSSSGGGFNFASVGSDALTDTINDAEPAVDKSTSPATVGIPVTGHAFLAGHEVTIGGTANYNGSFVIDSVSANEVVIVSSFSAETFSGTDTIVSSIKTDSIEGVETANTFSSTVSEDGVYHVIDDDGSNNFTISYRFEIGGGRLATEAVFHGFLNSNNDNALIQAYDFVGDAWETRALLTGQNGSVNQAITISLLARNTGTSAPDVGVVLLRITDDTPRGSSNPTLNVDSLLVEAVGVGQTAGYQNGAIWIDTNKGTAGTESFVNGTADNPALTLADANTLAANLGMSKFAIAPLSSITFAASQDNQVFTGTNWTLALGGQSVSATHIIGADVSGICSGASKPRFTNCVIRTVTLPASDVFDSCLASGTITLGAGNQIFDKCFSGVAGSGAPILDFGAGVGNTDVGARNYSGGLHIHNMGQNGTDTMSLEGRGQYIFNANCIGGTLKVAGLFDETDNAGGAVTVIGTARYDTFQINAQVDAALNTAIPGGATANSINERIAALDDLAQAGGAGDLAAILADTGTDGVLVATAAVNDIARAILPQKNQPYADIEFLFVAASDHATPVTGASGTGVTRSIDGGAFGAATGTLAEVGNGIYQFDASAADMNGSIITLRFTGTGGTPGAPDDVFLTLVTAA